MFDLGKHDFIFSASCFPIFCVLPYVMAPKYRPKQHAVVTLHTQATPETKQENGTDKVDSQMAVLLHRAEILAHMQGPLTVIQGDTGCGKSSQVPQFVLDNVLNPKIIVTQPRRLAAISLAVLASHNLEGNNHVFRLELHKREGWKRATSQLVIALVSPITQPLMLPCVS